MTDNEVVKALECCLEPNKCGECPLMSSVDEYKEVCLDVLLKSAKNKIECLKKEKAEVKSEAIKEFAERLKEGQIIDNLSLDGKYFVYVEDIDNLVKEMTESEEK